MGLWDEGRRSRYNTSYIAVSFPSTLSLNISLPMAPAHTGVHITTVRVVIGQFINRKHIYSLSRCDFFAHWHGHFQFCLGLSSFFLNSIILFLLSMSSMRRLSVSSY
ncbi:hypothetical protein HGRIS_001246 [Hohenbuehelia grisea]|uniref:Uncharacterized protein n=1 Tax=Hohenbuehelia grisea TaxID=104357 RepID=A0ABR3JNQ5_9AGAR